MHLIQILEINWLLLYRFNFNNNDSYDRGHLNLIGVNDTIEKICYTYEGNILNNYRKIEEYLRKELVNLIDGITNPFKFTID